MDLWRHMEAEMTDAEKALEWFNFIMKCCPDPLHECEQSKTIRTALQRADECDDILPCSITVGAGTFHKGVKVSTVQGAIDGLYSMLSECNDAKREIASVKDKAQGLTDAYEQTVKTLRAGQEPVTETGRWLKNVADEAQQKIAAFKADEMGVKS